MWELGNWLKNHPKEIVFLNFSRIFMPGSMLFDLKTLGRLCKIIEDTVGTGLLRPKDINKKDYM